jgi:hypothetical protein
VRNTDLNNFVKRILSYPVVLQCSCGNTKKSQQSNTTPCNEWHITMLQVSIQKKSSSGSSLKKTFKTRQFYKFCTIISEISLIFFKKHIIVFSLYLRTCNVFFHSCFFLVPEKIINTSTKSLIVGCCVCNTARTQITNKNWCPLQSIQMYRINNMYASKRV